MSADNLSPEEQQARWLEEGKAVVKQQAFLMFAPRPAAPPNAMLSPRRALRRTPGSCAPAARSRSRACTWRLPCAQPGGAASLSNFSEAARKPAQCVDAMRRGLNTKP